jgi:hypothetical protein
MILGEAALLGGILLPPLLAISCNNYDVCNKQLKQMSSGRIIAFRGDRSPHELLDGFAPCSVQF